MATSRRERAAQQAQLADGCARMGVALPDAALGRLLDYRDQLLRWNRAYNLTAVRAPEEMVVRHLLDSLSVLPYLPRGPLIDVGSGAGLPGVPLALADPARLVAVLEANGKKAAFLRHVKRVLKCGRLDVIQSRAEDFRPSAPFAGVVTRAFASLPDMLRTTAHLAAPDGQWLAMKGRRPDDELRALPAGYRVAAVHRIDVPFLDEARHLVAIAWETRG